MMTRIGLGKHKDRTRQKVQIDPELQSVPQEDCTIADPQSAAVFTCDHVAPFSCKTDNYKINYIKHVCHFYSTI